ncbi:MAG: class I SAM-dependent DNA methyltransferase [Chitinophagales bacterium]
MKTTENSVYQEKVAYYYDLIYEFKDYGKDAETLHKIIAKHKQTAGNELLEAACGTGKYTPFLSEKYNYTGFDLSQNMVNVAQRKFPEQAFLQADMLDFSLDKKFDIIVCLFSSIAYLKTYENLQTALENFYKHLKKDGILIVEPFIDAKDYTDGFLGLTTVDKPDIKISRQNLCERVGDVSVMDMHHLVTTAKGTEYFVEQHELALYDTPKAIAMMQQIGFAAHSVPSALIKSRHVWVGVK